MSLSADALGLTSREAWRRAWRFARTWSRGHLPFAAWGDALDEVALRLLHLRHGVEPPQDLGLPIL